jgi:acetolactate synthase-1/3 small subunit
MYVENRNGVLARISGLMSGKCYNIDSITVGTTEDPTVSRMTIGLYSDEPTFEQIKKQLNRCVETIKVIDITDAPTHMKELLFIHIKECSEFEKGEIFRVAQVFGAKPIDYGMDSVLL